MGIGSSKLWALRVSSGLWTFFFFLVVVVVGGGGGGGLCLTG